MRHQFRKKKYEKYLKQQSAVFRPPKAVEDGGMAISGGTTVAPADAGRYMPGLDGLRALAILAVTAYHVTIQHS